MLDFRIVFGAIVICASLVVIGVRLLATNDALTVAIGDRPEIETTAARRTPLATSAREPAGTSQTRTEKSIPAASAQARIQAPTPTPPPSALKGQTAISVPAAKAPAAATAPATIESAKATAATPPQTAPAPDITGSLQSEAETDTPRRPTAQRAARPASVEPLLPLPPDVTPPVPEPDAEVRRARPASRQVVIRRPEQDPFGQFFRLMVPVPNQGYAQ
jgi:hypothetical protein